MAKKPVTKKPAGADKTKLVEPKPVKAKTEAAAKDEAAASEVSANPASDKPAKSTSGGGAGKLVMAVGLLLCGAAAGALLGPRFAPQYFGTDTSAIEARLLQYQTAMDNRIAALEAKEAPDFSGEIEQAVSGLSSEVQSNLEALETKIVATDGGEIEARLAEAETTIAGLRAAFESMTEDLNAANATGTNAQIDTTLAEIASLQSQIQELSAMNGALSQKIDEIDISATQSVEEAAHKSAEIQAEAEATTNAAERDRLTGNLDAAMQRGEALSPYLEALSGLGISIPQSLSDAANGVVRLSDLQESFSPAAHAALRADASNSSEASGVRGQLQSFFQSQISIRSLDAKDGDSTDAVLSRMEQALEQADLAVVLDEATKLSEPAKNAMAEWLAQASNRLAAFQALDQLKQAS